MQNVLKLFSLDTMIHPGFAEQMTYGLYRFRVAIDEDLLWNFQ
jgi:hypothetical protein